MSETKKTAVVTGASSGIGAATARALAQAGYAVTVGARRLDRLEALAGEIGGRALPLDVTDPASVQAFVAAVREDSEGLNLLVNNAGGAIGLDRLEDSRDDSWETMFATNVLGVVRVTRALLPALVASGAGHIVNLGSTAGRETYPGGSGYTAAKHGLKALTQTLRVELLGRPVRVTEVAPGLVGETEFSLVRFGGDAERARAVYQGLDPLTPEDVADCIVWAATRPAHVNIDEIVLRPLAQAQASSTAPFRRPS
ncbi:MAG TPA: SDR family NAD(P)-dependent oxidoreductase [Thermoanaerobaculia bacterium]|nr:SDR family NAD(P)-dependent oxidoreductase [Thermoanaerobaculia bacterium]